METTHIYYLLDESGSMENRKKSLLSSMNELIQEQKKYTGFISMYSFQNVLRTIFENMAISDVKPLEESDYQPSGLTALYDAMGFLLEKKIDTSKTGKHLLIVLTDGEENASTLYDVGAITELLTKHQDRLQIMYLGSNQDAILQGSRIGATPRSSLNYEDGLINEAMRSASDSIHRYVTNMTPVVEFTELEREKSMTPQIF